MSLPSTLASGEVVEQLQSMHVSADNFRLLGDADHARAHGYGGGLMAYTVVQRTQEIRILLALGGGGSQVRNAEFSATTGLIDPVI
jgi:hypothetical protein